MDLATLALVAVFTRDLVAVLTRDPEAALILAQVAALTPDLAEDVIPGLAVEVMTRGTVSLPTVADRSSSAEPLIFQKAILVYIRRRRGRWYGAAGSIRVMF